ncbi:GAK system CofD-like protein [Nitratidesulfovibrio sp. HK-II]|uniref:GAK system CofD-like protein n=1 Tax=Nitratidesulfovibrio sp. HK-II TaxID=2009266 RepID=UPI000E2F41BF|nr:GAK system CofD-like protein [Nitratidesulfovibrio sp. HK-II]
MARLLLTRQVTLPDPVKVERFTRAPDLGPRILFFSGGTALRDASTDLARYTHNSVHLITPFDSGGSSARLRQAFGMPAVGDLRNRLMALADRSLHGNPAVFRLFAFRLPAEGDRGELADTLVALAQGRHPLVRAIPDPLRKIVRSHIGTFIEHAGLDKDGGFDPRGASLGNIVLASGYLQNRRHLDPVIFIFSKLVQVRGVVRPIANADLHLAVKLADGRVIGGQHRFTGKNGTPPLTARIDDIWLCKSPDDTAPADLRLRAKVREIIATAELVCYPVGSFYSSVIANLLPSGVGAALAATRCPKVFVPNTGNDPELLGHTLELQVERLLRHLRGDAPDAIAPRDVLDFVLVDTKGGRYPGGIPRAMLQRLAELGIRVLDCPLVSRQSAPYIDERLLNPVLLSLC